MKSLVFIIVMSLCGFAQAQTTLQTTPVQRSAVSDLVAGSARTQQEPPGPHCIYNDDNGICVRCGQSTCAGSSQQSITDCFAAPECAGTDSGSTAPGSLAIESPQPVPVQCSYHPNTGACYALTSSGSIPATVPDAQACADHCAAH